LKQRAIRWKKPEVDYRNFRLNRLNTPEFSHLKWLLFWPIHGLVFGYLERFYPVSSYYTVHCMWDDLIPFNEIFLIPYLFWFVFLAGMVVYTLLYDVEAFKRMMKFIAITYGLTLVIYFIFPTSQNLRPETFARDNILTRFTAWFYTFDTNTNVCPSIHVLGAMAAMYAGWDCKNLQKYGWKIAFFVTAMLINISTVFMKQHSVVDVVAALILCVVFYPVCYPRRELRKATRKELAGV
jgi:membrane-associated phospholipid phosphatase